MARIDVSELPARARESLDRGEAVEVFNGDDVVGVVRPAADRLRWMRYLDQRDEDPPLDYDAYLADLERAREALNAPADYSRWA